MRLKPVPDPDTDVTLGEAQSAVPLVPAATDDCCQRLVSLTRIESVDAARTWLTFLRALGLVREVSTGYVRMERDPTDPTVPEAFVSSVYGAREVLDILEGAERPLTPDLVFDRVDLVPRWAGHRERNTDATWRDRIESLLQWAVHFGLATSTDEGYRWVSPETSR